MMTCKETAYLVSESLDHTLSFYKRLVVKLHIIFCDACSRYQKQLEAIKKISGTYGHSGKDFEIDTISDTLSEKAKNRIKDSLGREKPDHS